MMEHDRTGGAVKAAHTTLSIVEEISQAGSVGVTELADSVGLSKGVVYNHLGTLSELGYVQKEDGRYRPSLHLLSLGSRTRTKIEPYRVRPHPAGCHSHHAPQAGRPQIHR